MTETVAQFVQEIIEEIHYYDTILPRIPVIYVHTYIHAYIHTYIQAYIH